MWSLILIGPLYLSGAWQGLLLRTSYNEIRLCAQNVNIILSSTNSTHIGGPSYVNTYEEREKSL